MTLRNLLLASALFLALGATFASAPPVSAQASQARVVVIFLSGWRSTLTQPEDVLADWRSIDESLQSAFPGDVAAYVYSYRYVPNPSSPASPLAVPPYDVADTNQSIVTSAQALDDQIADLRVRHPGARFVLIGHSLGGAVATYWAGSHPDSRLHDIAGIITLDSPVRGVPWADVYTVLQRYGVIRLAVGRPSVLAIGAFVLRTWLEADPNWGAGGPMIDQLDNSITPETMTAMAASVANLKTVGGNVHNAFDCRDPFIFCTHAALANASRLEVPGSPADCAFEAAAQAHLAERMPSIFPAPPAFRSPGEILDCLQEAHGRVRELPETVNWVRDILADIIEDLPSLPGQPPEVSADSSTMLVMDVSGSMDEPGKIDAARSAAVSALELVVAENAAGSGSHRAGLVVFNEQAYEIEALTPAIASVQGAANSMTADGGTDVYLGALAAFEALVIDPAPIRAMIVMTDGIDERSVDEPGWQDLLLRARTAGICIHTVAFGVDAVEEYLRGIAGGSGCGTFSPASTEFDGFALTPAFRRARLSTTGSLVVDAHATISQGQVLEVGGFAVSRDTGEIVASLSWPGSAATLILTDPQGRTVGPGYEGASITATGTDVTAIIRDPAPGPWSVRVRGDDVPEGLMPVYAGVATRLLPADGGSDRSAGGVLLAVAVLVAGVLAVTVVALATTQRQRGTGSQRR